VVPGAEDGNAKVLYLQLTHSDMVKSLTPLILMHHGFIFLLPLMVLDHLYVSDETNPCAHERELERGEE